MVADMHHPQRQSQLSLCLQWPVWVFCFSFLHSYFSHTDWLQRNMQPH